MSVRRLFLITAALIYSTVAEAPKMIESITLFKIQEFRDKMAIEEERIRVSMLRYLWEKRYNSIISYKYFPMVKAIYSAHKEFDLPTAIIMAIIEVESSLRQDVVSHKGARGLMQIMPVWDETLIKEGIIETTKQIFDIARNIRAGCWVFQRYFSNSVVLYLSASYEQLFDHTLNVYSGGGGQEYIAKVRDSMKRIETFLNEEK